ncbi:polyphosphate kinase [Ditylenchus destructor]|uniref:Polyphosphate kinase n=1 Tax=Ditylenchus destructor TaxID=166010 RepID=A0AAD4QUK8_9BILA|nr:polyphosphate kinase [Ditylenchus destructor]
MEEAANTAHPRSNGCGSSRFPGSNLDEFFMVRVAGLKGQQMQEVEAHSADGRTPGSSSPRSWRMRRLVDPQQTVWNVLRRELGERGIEVLDADAIVGGGRRLGPVFISVFRSFRS